MTNTEMGGCSHVENDEALRSFRVPALHLEMSLMSTSKSEWGVTENITELRV